jgi:hypothetical protein
MRLLSKAGETIDNTNGAIPFVAAGRMMGAGSHLTNNLTKHHEQLPESLHWYYLPPRRLTNADFGR